MGSRTRLLAIGAFIALMYACLLFPQPLISTVTYEGGAAEWLGFVSLLAAGSLFLFAFLRARHHGSSRLKQLFLLGLGMALLVGAGEELNWGQHIFNIEAPKEIAERNYQGELNLHNLSVLGPWGVWRAFEIFTLVFVVVVPLVAWRSPRLRAKLSRHVAIVPLALGGLFLLTQVMVAVSELVFHFEPALWHGTQRMSHGRAEITEASFALLYAVVGFDLVRRESNESASGGRFQRRPPR